MPQAAYTEHGDNITGLRRCISQVGLQPDIIVAHSTPATIALQRETRTIPIVFASVGDPVYSHRSSK
jgi:putative ABC transport system substrate-binding protein